MKTAEARSMLDEMFGPESSNEGEVVTPENDPDFAEEQASDANRAPRGRRARSVDTPTTMRVRLKSMVIGVGGDGSVLEIPAAEAQRLIAHELATPATLEQHGAMLDLIAVKSHTRTVTNARGGKYVEQCRPGEMITVRVGRAQELVNQGVAIPSAIFAIPGTLTFAIDETTGKWRASCEFAGQLFGS